MRSGTTIPPTGSEEEKYRFELLRRAYVDARYKKTYRIIREELLWFEERVKHLRTLPEEQCAEKIASFISIEKVDFHKKTWCFLMLKLIKNPLFFYWSILHYSPDDYALFAVPQPPLNCILLQTRKYAKAKIYSTIPPK